MKKKLVMGFLVVALLIFVIATNLKAESKSDKIDSKIYEKLQNSNNVKVIIELNDQKVGKTTAIKDKQTESANTREIFTSVSNNELQNLQNDPAIERVRLDEVKHIWLQNSVPLINATQTWQLQQSGLNLTGLGQTVCIIDTGVNYTHPDLGGCYGNNTASSSCKVIGGYNYVANTTDPMDDNGHGTHVAGIVAANGTITGVAPQAKIVAVKVCDSGGNCDDSNILKGIDWCVNNATMFNISVISMSLGGDVNYTAYCDNNLSENSDIYAQHINGATAKNISVIIAAGNSGNYTSVSSPACAQNATVAGSSTKADAISSFSNRWALKMLFAPGQSINSTMLTNPNLGLGCASGKIYCQLSGTSMATPHIAGAFALINEYLKLTNQNKTPKQIESALNNTGKVVHDSLSNLNYSRIDVYDAVISLDNQAPNVTLVSPSNNFITTNENLTFQCNATNLALKNVSFYIWNSSGGVYYSASQTVSGSNNLTQFTVNNITITNYTWNCQYADKNNNLAMASMNFSVQLNQNPKHFIFVLNDGLQAAHFYRLLASGNLSNYSRLINNGGWNGTANITGHIDTETAPGNAELLTGLNETLNNVSSNSPVTLIPAGKTIFERLKNYDSSIKTGFVYGKTRPYVPNGIMQNALSSVDWAYNISNFNNSDWPYDTSTNYIYSENVSTKALEFLQNYANSSFFLVVYYGVPDGSGHAFGENSSQYDLAVEDTDNALGLLLNELAQTGLNTSTQILISADHGWNTNTTGHSIANADTIILPLLSNNVSLIENTLPAIRKQCSLTPTVLNYFGISTLDYLDIYSNGCYSMINDSRAPQITVNNPTSSSFTSLPISLSISLDEFGAYCYYSIDTGSNVSLSTSDNVTFTSSIGSLSSGSRNINLVCSDVSGNLNSSKTLSITYSPPNTQTTSSGGSSGGSSSPASPLSNVYYITKDQLSQGYTSKFSKGDKLKFVLGNENHTLTTNEIKNNSVDITLSSASISLNLLLGHPVKLNLSSTNSYDLLVTLNNILNNKANITIKEISELINSGTKQISENNNSDNLNQSSSSNGNTPKLPAGLYYIFYIIGFIIIVAVVILFLVKRNMNKQSNALLIDQIKENQDSNIQSGA